MASAQSGAKRGFSSENSRPSEQKTVGTGLRFLRFYRGFILISTDARALTPIRTSLMREAIKCWEKRGDFSKQISCRVTQDRPEKSLKEKCPFDALFQGLE